jgi:hypothetical protein
MLTSGADYRVYLNFGAIRIDEAFLRYLLDTRRVYRSVWFDEGFQVACNCQSSVSLPSNLNQARITCQHRAWDGDIQGRSSSV